MCTVNTQCAPAAGRKSDLDSAQFPLKLRHIMLLLLEPVDYFLLHPGHLLLLTHITREDCDCLSLPCKGGGGASWAGPYLLAEPLGLHRHCGVSSVSLQDADGTNTRVTGATVDLHRRTQHAVTRETQHISHHNWEKPKLKYYWRTAGVLLL